MTDRLFGTEIFTEIEQEILKFKDMYPYSKLNHAYNVIVDLCAEAVKVVAERKKKEIGIKNDQIKE
jgi:hypothetical protein